jgi:nucleotidyltransferase substrate binding protein (TIGR01987 family)
MALTQKLTDFNKALLRLGDALEQAAKHQNKTDFSFFRDSTIQRFEFTLEIAWKSIKTYLLEHEGIECRSPKSCMREFLAAGYLNPTQITTLLTMIDDRNLATHTYHESLADEIYQHIQNYFPILENIYQILKEQRQ